MGKTRIWVLVFSDNNLGPKQISRINLDSAQYLRLNDSINRIQTKATIFSPWINSVVPPPLKIFSLVIKWAPTKIIDTVPTKQLKDLTSKLSANTTIKSIQPEKLFMADPTSPTDKKQYTDFDSAKLARNPNVKSRTVRVKDILYKLTILNNPTSKIIDGLDSITCYTMLRAMHDSICDSNGSVSVVSRPRKTFNVTYNVPAYVIKRNTLAYQPQPGEISLSGLVASFASIFSGGKASLPAQQTPGNPLSDSSVTFSDVIKLIYDKKDTCCGTNCEWTTDTLYVGSASFNIAPNSKDRITIVPNDHTDINSIAYNFGNFETTLVTVGAGMAVNYNPFADRSFYKFDNHWGITGRNPRQPDNDGFAKFYIYVHYYLWKPQLPIRKRSFALVLGTNLSNTNPLQDIVFGIRYGYDRVGFMLGENYMVYDNKSRGMVSQLGIDYRL